MTGQTLYDFLASLQPSERQKEIRLETGIWQHFPLREIDDADPDYVWLKANCEMAHEN